MNQLLPLSVVLPLLVAAAIAALGWLLRPRRRVLDGIAISTCAAVVVLLAVILADAARRDLVYWFGGFRPSHGIAIGIDFGVGPLSAGLALLAAVLVTASMVFSWRYFEEISTYYHALMLTFLAGMVGFCLTGDIFDMFVWFELMGVSAYALTAYRPEERGSLQGALNFAISNSVGAYLTLSGIALVYGRTGALNMAQIGVRSCPPTARRPGRRGVRADHRRVPDQKRHRAVPFLAGRRPCRGADARLRAVLRRDGGTRPVRHRAGLLVSLRPGARSLRRRSGPRSRPWGC